MVAIRSKSILLKIAVCGISYLIFSLMIIFVAYIIDIFLMTLVLGTLYGIIVAIIACCDTQKETIKTSAICVLSAIVLQILISMSGVPYRIILFILRHDDFVRETGRLTINETIGYGFGIIFFQFGFIPSLFVSIFIIFNLTKVRTK